jgi:transposase-like protein
MHRGKTSFGMLSACAAAAVFVRSSRRDRRSLASGFPREVIVLAVRWYLRYGLSYRDVEEIP